MQKRIRPESKKAIAARVARHRIRKRRLADWERATGQELQALTRAQELALNAWYRDRGVFRPWRYPLLAHDQQARVRMALTIQVTPELNAFYLGLLAREIQRWCRRLPGDWTPHCWDTAILSDYCDAVNRAYLKLPLPQPEK
jgi:hypothetical protein